jgi:putative oxidoreductase
MRAWGPVVLRVAVGAVFVANGLPKLLPVGGQGGLQATAIVFESLGLRPALPLALLIGLVETLGGLALVLGAFTLVSCLALIAVMAFAAWALHVPHGFLVGRALASGPAQGYELSVVLIAALASLGMSGPGALSLDHRRARDEEALRAGRARIVRRY